MFGIDVEMFRVLKPWRDWSFWAAVLWSAGLLGALAFPDAAAWVHRNQAALIAAVAPLTTWLAMHGLIRAHAASALGTAAGYAALGEHGPNVDDETGD